MHVVIRRAKAEEYAAAGELTVAAYVGDGFIDRCSPYVDQLRNAAVRADLGTLLVAVDEETCAVVGTASVFTAAAGPTWAEHAGPYDAVLRMLAVAADARGRGIGRALTVAAVDEARALGCTRVLLSTQQGMVAAHALYESLGFRRAPERDWQPENDEWLLGYVLEL